MNGLIASAKKIEEYGALLDCVKSTRLPIGMTGLSHIHKAHFAAALNADCGRPVLVITADEAQASRLALDMKTLGCRALLYPARDLRSARRRASRANMSTGGSACSTRCFAARRRR